MEKETLIQEFKNRIGENNASGRVLSDRTISQMADAYLQDFADDSAITDATWEKPVSALTAMRGQILHEKKDWIQSKADGFASEKENAVKTAKEEAQAALLASLKKKFPNIDFDGTKAETPKVDKSAEGGQDINAIVSAAVQSAINGLVGDDGVVGKLAKEMSDFTSRIKEKERDENIKTTRKALRSYLEERNASKGAAIDLAIERTEIDEGKTLAELKTAVEANYEKIFKEFYGDGYKPYGGQSEGSGEGSDAQMKQYLENRKKEEAGKRDRVSALEKSFI